MNRYPLWKYLIIAVALVIGALYALPNLFGESPAVQVSAGRASVRIDTTTVTRVEQALTEQGVSASLIQFEGNSVRARFETTDDQIKARDLPGPLQNLVLQLNVGETTPPFGSIDDGVRVLMLCGRDDPKDATAPDFEQVQGQIEDERVNKRAQAYLRDLRRDAVIDYD